jgi:HSP20 family protein
MDEKDVSVTLNNVILTLKGEKKSEREGKKDDYHLMERSYGSFQRSFRVADVIDADEVKAAFDKGVLKVTMPKRPEAIKAEKRITIGKG